MSYHTACLLFLICFWGLLLYSYAHPVPQHKAIDYNAYKPHYRHQRSFPRFYNPEMRDAMYQPQMGPMERPMYRRNAGYSEPPMYPPQRGGYEEPYPYHPRQPMVEPPRDLFRVVPRGADEEYDTNPLTTKVVTGFDEEDEDMMREEELGDQLELLDQQAPTRFISEGIAKKPKQVSYQMEMAPPQGRRTPFRPPPPMLLPEEEFQYQDEMYPTNPHHAQHKRYQPSYQYYHQQPDYYQPEYEPRYPEPMYQTPPHPRRMMPPVQKTQPKRKPIPKIPEPVIYDDEFDDVESELPIISEEDDIVMKMPVKVAEIKIEEVRTVDDDVDDSAVSVDDYFEHDDGYYSNPQGEYFEEPEEFETQEEDTTVMPKMTMPKTTMPKTTMSKMPMPKMTQQSESETAEVSESQDEIMQDTRSTQESSESQGSI